MIRCTWSAVLVLPMLLAGCPAGFEANIFPVWPANFFESPPADLGPFATTETVVDVPDGADGAPTKITVFAPLGSEGPRPAFVWVLGSNVQPYYHQSLHENLASWGYVVIVPDARPLTFTDFQYHRRNVDLARQALDLALSGDLGAAVDPERIAVGGYSIGATQAVFVAAEDARVKAGVLWAPTSAPFWTGVNPAGLFPLVTQRMHFILAELDHVEPPTGFPKRMQEQMTQATSSEFIIPQGLHLYFQQPTGADNITDPVSTLTRFEQQGIAIDATRLWLDQALGVAR